MEITWPLSFWKCINPLETKSTKVMHGSFQFFKIGDGGNHLEGLVSSWLCEKGPILIKHCWCLFCWGKRCLFCWRRATKQNKTKLCPRWEMITGNNWENGVCELYSWLGRQQGLCGHPALSSRTWWSPGRWFHESSPPPPALRHNCQHPSQVTPRPRYLRLSVIL